MTLLSALLIAPAALLIQQEEMDAVAVRVLAAQGQLVQIDRGKEAGVEPGDRVRLRPLGQAERFGRVQSVAERTAWVLMLPGPEGDTGIDIGTGGEVELPRGRRVPEGQGADYRERSGPLPETEPAWSTPAEPADPTRPLLEQLGTRPEEREPTWSGRTWLSSYVSAERAIRNSHSVFARAGIDLDGNNPFGYGGALHFRSEFDFRAFDAEGEASESEPAVRLERASYRRGGQRFETRRLEMGRFLQHGFPELGLLDGLEAQWGRPDRHRVGLSAGWLPEGTQELTTGNDFQLAAFYRGAAGGEALADTRWRWGAAVQQTWHDGEADRSLLLLQADWMRGAWAWRNAAWLDYYDADDNGKEQGLEPTLAYSLFHWSERSWGGSASLRHWRFPQLLRFQAGNFVLLDLFEDRTTRGDVSLWWRTGARTRIRVRVDHWSSRDRDGSGIELRGSWTDLLAEGLTTSASIFQHEGAFTDATGIRLDQSLPRWAGNWRLHAESVRFDERIADRDAFEHELRAHWFGNLGPEWSMSLDLGWRFGEDQNSPSLSLFFSRSF